ncbi:MAG: hypothetical protein HOW73_33820 [Polyangiaceae bacterium]|nr:hypothetical protein [Polyangiaceae bacterium]
MRDLSLLRSSTLVRAITFSLALAAPAVAHANGRFPDAQQLVVHPNDPNQIAVQVTYGFIRTRDGGQTWHWTCEQAASYGGVLDPPIALVESDAMIAGVFDGLVVTSPDGCDVGLYGGELTDRFTVDVSTIKGDPSRAIALSSDGIGSNGFDTRVWKTTDSALTWTQLGIALPNDFLAFTLDAAPDDENLLYVSGFRVVASNDYVGSLAVSADGGQTWEVKPIQGSDNDSGPYIAAIDPNDSQTLYVRLASLAGVLLVTHDAGNTWQPIFTGEGALLGFALSPDGSEIRVGGDIDGIWKASTTDLSFEKINDMGVRCLTWTPDYLYACAREALADFTIGRSTDGGVTFEPIHHLNCLGGPDPACEAGTTIADVCEAPWGMTKQLIQTETCEDGSGGAGGSGQGGAGGAATDGGDADGDDGCSCRAGAGTSNAASAIALVAIALGAGRLLRARRRRL